MTKKVINNILRDIKFARITLSDDKKVSYMVSDR